MRQNSLGIGDECSEIFNKYGGKWLLTNTRENTKRTIPFHRTTLVRNSMECPALNEPSRISRESNGSSVDIFN